MADVFWLVCLVLGLLGGLTGCAPAELAPLPDGGADNESLDAALSDAEGNGEPDSDTAGGEAASFPQVAQTLATSCGQAFCHGESHNGNFDIEGGTEASVDAVRLALEDVDSLAEIPLIAAGSPSDSAIYQRITGEGNMMPPPPNASLSQEQIEMIHGWISEGARYE
jgi:hypothetical protein